MLDKDGKVVVIALTLVILILGVLFVMDRSGSRRDRQEESYGGLYGQTDVVDPHSAVPYDGDTILTTTVDLKWRAGKRATSHVVFLHGNEQWVVAGDPNAVLTETQETRVEAVDLAPDTTYYWRVDAVNPKEPNSPWRGHVWQFRIPPRQAFDLFPPDGATHVSPNVRLTWERAADSVAYRVALGTDAHVVANAPGERMALPTTSYEPNELNPGATSYWRVDVVTEDSIVAGKVQSFTILDDTAYFGGISMHMCTWSVQICPSTIRHSFWRAKA
jgi:hypothetical protein